MLFGWEGRNDVPNHAVAFLDTCDIGPDFKDFAGDVGAEDVGVVLDVEALEGSVVRLQEVVLQSHSDPCPGIVSIGVSCGRLGVNSLGSSSQLGSPQLRHS